MDTVKECGSLLGWTLLALAACDWALSRRQNWTRSAVAAGFVFLAAAAPLVPPRSMSERYGQLALVSHGHRGWCGLIGIVAAIRLVPGLVHPKSKVQGQTTEDTGEPKLSPVAPDHLQVAPEAFDLGPRLATWSLWLTPVVALFAIRGLWSDPLRPWWSAGSVIWISLCTLLFAVTTVDRVRAEWRVYLSLGFAALGSVFIGLNPWLWSGEHVPDQKVLDLIHITLIGMALQALVWTAVVVCRERRGAIVERIPGWPPAHHFVAVVGTLAAALPAFVVLGQAVARSFVRTDLREPITPASPLAGRRWHCWPPRAWRHCGNVKPGMGLPTLYALGLIAIATGLGRFNLPHRELIVWTTCSLAGLRRRHERRFGHFDGRFGQSLASLGGQLAEDEGEATHNWLTASTWRCPWW